MLTCFPHVASASAEEADADRRVLGEFDEGAGPIRGGSDADKRALREFDEGAGLISNFLICARHTSVVFESGHPRADAAHASI